MTVGELKKLIEKMPDDTPILVPGDDHSYRAATASNCTALLERRNQWTEDYGEEMTPEKEYGKRVKALIVM